MEWLSHWCVIPLAYALDLVLGDPLRMPHPVRWMGRAIAFWEEPFRKSPLPLAISGGLFALSLTGGAYLLAWGLVAAAGAWHPMARTILEIVLAYYCLASTSLDRAARAVEKPLRRGGLEEARRALSMIVSRETNGLSHTQACRAAVETVAENFVDGVLSPLFWLVLGGAPGAVAFKMASTLDSMVGYRNSRYELFGKAAARLDDAANFIPARFSAPCIALAARILGLYARSALETAIREGGNHASPNAGYPEAAFAGALHVKLNGPAVYHGQWVDKPFVGVRFSDPTVGHITQARRLMAVSSAMGVLAFTLVLFILAFR